MDDLGPIWIVDRFGEGVVVAVGAGAGLTAGGIRNVLDASRTACVTLIVVRRRYRRINRI